MKRHRPAAVLVKFNPVVWLVTDSTFEDRCDEFFSVHGVQCLGEAGQRRLQFLRRVMAKNQDKRVLLFHAALSQPRHGAK